MIDPWSAVEVIEDTTGLRGGRAWLLRLACGHVAIRSNPELRLRQILSKRRLRLAPKRVRCWMCGAIARRVGQ